MPSGCDNELTLISMTTLDYQHFYGDVILMGPAGSRSAHTRTLVDAPGRNDSTADTVWPCTYATENVGKIDWKTSLDRSCL